MPRPSGTRTDLQSAIYNPGLLTREALTRSFVARKQVLKMLEDELLAASDHTAGQQHRLFHGPRGMGKTTLLLRLQYLVEDDATLSHRWVPVSFVEEKYGIGDLADFWLEVLRGLPPTRQEPNPEALTERLHTRYHADSERLAQAAFDALQKWVKQEKKQLLLLIDNLNEVFEHIGDERQLHQLRAILMESPWLKLIGFSPTYFDQLDQTNAPFYEFFLIDRLETISLEETREILTHWSELDERPDLLERLTHRQGRIKNLHTLTGGNPRLVAVMYELLKEGPLNSTLEDVQKLVDRMTPYFKAQVDGLPVQSRRLVDALAKRWGATSTRELADDLRQPSNQVSAQLSRLKRDGWISTRGGEGKHTSYQLADRFYNIYYLMRHARSQMQRLKGFVFFLQVLFEDEDLKRLAESVRGYLQELPETETGEKALQIARLSMIAEASTDVDQKTQLYAAALHHSRSLTGESHRLEELVDLPLARQVLGDERIETEEQIRALEVERAHGKLPFERMRTLADHYTRVGEWAQAEARLRECLTLKPGDNGVCCDIAMTLAQQQRTDEALVMLDLSDTPESKCRAHCANLRGAILLVRGDMHASEQCFREALTHQWNAVYAVNLANILLAQGKEEAARTILEKNAENREADANQLLILHQLAEKGQDRKKAEKYLLRAAEKDPFCEFLLAAYLRKHGNTTKAKKALKHARERLGKAVRPPTFYVQLYQAFFALQAFEEAEELSRHQEEIEGSHRGLGRFHRIILFATSHRPDDAQRTLKDALDRRLSPQQAAWWGEKFHQNGFYALAEQCAAYAIRQDNDLPKGYLVLAATYFNQNLIQKAYHCVVKSQQLDSGIAWGNRLRALCTARLGLWEECTHYAGRWAERASNHWRPWAIQLEAAHRLRQTEQQAACEKRLSSLITTSELAINHSHETLQIGLPYACTFIAQLGTKLMPESAMAWNNYSAGLNALGRFEEGLAVARRAISIDGLAIFAWKNYFRACHALKQAELINEGVETLSKNPHLSIEQLRQVTECMANLGLDEPRLMLVQRYKNLHLTQGALWIEEVEILLHLGRWEEAHSVLESLPSDSTHTPVADQLGFLVACHRQELERARALWTRVKDQLPAPFILTGQALAQEQRSPEGWPGYTVFLAAQFQELFHGNLLRLKLVLSLIAAGKTSKPRMVEILSAIKQAVKIPDALPFPSPHWIDWCDALISILSQTEAATCDDREEKLEASLLPLESSHPDLALALWQCAATLLQPHFPEQATWCWSEVLRLAPDDVEALKALLQDAMQHADLLKQTSFLTRLITLEPEQLSHSLMLAHTLTQRRLFDDAEKLLKPLVKQYPYHFKLRLAYLAALWNVGRETEAQTLFQQLTQEQPLNAQPWLMGYTRLQGRTVQERLDWLERGLESTPFSPQLTYLWARERLLHPSLTGPSPEKLEAQVYKVFTATPQDPLYRELQALLLLKRGGWREALGILDALLQQPDTLAQHEKPMMDLALRVAAHGKPKDVVAVLQERHLEERWQPLLLALELAHDPRLERTSRAPQEILNVALELRDQLPEMRLR